MKKGSNFLSEAVAIKPFIYQVSGHNVILKYGNGCICKQFNSQEYRFYKTLAHRLGNFAAELNGLAEVSQVKENDKISYIAFPIDEYEFAMNEDAGVNDTRFPNKNKLTVRRLDSCSLSMDETKQPWYLEAQERFHQKWQKYDYNNKVFMIIENIMHKFNRPSTIDLKIGYRSYGDDTPEDKKARKINRVSSSTSNVCGVRLCGMQVFHPKDNEYIFRDKYYGRHLNMEDLRKAIIEYFFDGSTYRLNILKSVIEKLKELEDVVVRIDGIRFYASSILIGYDGSQTDYELSQNVELKLVDFAQSSFDSHPNNKECLPKENVQCNHVMMHTGPDDEFLLGLENLLNLLSDIEDELCSK